jgi:hypothetical protein
MALIKIPDRLVPGFRVLFGLSKEVQEKLVDHIIRKPIGTSIETLIDTVPKEIAGTREEFGTFISLLEPLYDAHKETQLPLDEFVSEFTSSLDEAKIPIPNKEDFEQLLRKLLAENKNYQLTEKLSDLVREGDRIFSTTRIVTDIRPMVDDEDDGSILGLIVVHQLRISFVENNERKSSYFLLNRTDLEELEKAIVRAKNKESTFKKAFTSDSNVFHEEK